MAALPDERGLRSAHPLLSARRTAARSAAVACVRRAQAVSVMAHGKYLVTNPVVPSFLMEGFTITFATIVASGYPKADAGLAGAAGIASDFTQVLPSSAATANLPATAANETIFVPKSVSSTPSGLNCYIKYTEPVGVAVPPVIGPAVTTSC